MTNFVYYLIGFFVMVYIARLLGEKALKHLDTEQKAGLIDLFAKERKFGSALVFCLVIAFLVVLQFRLIKPIVAFSVYFVVMVSYMYLKTSGLTKSLRPMIILLNTSGKYL